MALTSGGTLISCGDAELDLIYSVAKIQRSLMKKCYNSAKLNNLSILTICFEVNLNVFLHLSELFELGEMEIVVSPVGVSLRSVTSIADSENKEYIKTASNI